MGLVLGPVSLSVPRGRLGDCSRGEGVNESDSENLVGSRPSVSKIGLCPERRADRLEGEADARQQIHIRN